MTPNAALRYPRDLRGHGREPPAAAWPGNGRVAVQFALNYEEGGESLVRHGNAASEQFLSEMANPPAYPARHMEGICKYGSWVGVWRILREFERRRLPLTVLGVGDRVWVKRRVDIAHHWKARHPFDPATAFNWE